MLKLLKLIVFASVSIASLWAQSAEINWLYGKTGTSEIYIAKFLAPVSGGITCSILGSNRFTSEHDGDVIHPVEMNLYDGGTWGRTNFVTDSGKYYYNWIQCPQPVWQITGVMFGSPEPTYPPRVTGPDLRIGEVQTVLIRPLDIGRAVTAIRVEVGYTEGAAASNWRADRYDQILTGNITGVKAGEYQVLLNVTIELM